LNPISLLNLVSRWILFMAVAYKAAKTHEKSWALLSMAFFIDGLNIESYILNPLGIHIVKGAYDVASKIPNFAIALLLSWGALHLKYKKSEFRHVVLFGVLAVASYVWLFLLAANAFGEDNFAIKSSFPSLALGLSLIYLGFVLRDYVVPRHHIEELFPWGLMLLGALNLTYPVGRSVQWYSTMAFFAAALFRLAAALGALKFIFYPIGEPESARIVDITPGAYMFPSREGIRKRLGSLMVDPALVMVTREDPEVLKAQLHPDALVFWVTRAREGLINEKPAIYAVSPTNIGILLDLVAKAVNKGYRILCVDAFEYMAVENGFDSAFKFLTTLKDLLMARGGSVILTINPDSLDPRQEKLLEREFIRG